MSKAKRRAGLPDYLNKRGDAAKRKGDIEQARRYYLAALKIDPTSVAAKAGLAELEWQRGNLESAKQGFQAIADSNAPSSWRADALIAIGNINCKQGNLDEAYESYSRVLSIEIEETYPGENEWILAHAYNGMGAVEGSRGNMVAAIQLFADALRHAPNHAASLVNMAWCYVDMGKTYAALHALTTALEIEPHRGDWAYEVGKLYHEVGKPHLARRWYERALQMGEDRARKSLDVLPSETAEQWYDTGQEYEAAGEFAIAQRCYERALRMGESRAREALDRLRSIANEE